MSGRPAISIVIPVYNEQAILHAAIVDLRVRLEPLGWAHEIVLAENGSRDRTVEIAKELEDSYPEIRRLSVGEPNYGAALRAGIRAARGDIVICDEIDLCDVDFHRRAVEILSREPIDLVIGSKLMAGASDERPFVRHAASLLYSRMLRWAVDFQGSDTHGLKAFRREALLPVLDECRVDRDVFASELVVRAYRRGLAIREIPVVVLEKRTPSINLTRRVPNVLKNLVKLTWAIRSDPRRTR